VSLYTKASPVVHTTSGLSLTTFPLRTATKILPFLELRIRHQLPSEC
jgi:hypothetical protein